MTKKMLQYKNSEPQTWNKTDDSKECKCIFNNNEFICNEKHSI